MKVSIFLDESGHIHKNSTSRFFAIGGYCVCEQDRYKVLRNYKKANRKIKKECNIPMTDELKARMMTPKQKIRLFSSVQNIPTFCGIAIVFDKYLMKKEIINENIFFNYGVSVLLDDLIFPLFDMGQYIEFDINIDNRNVSVNKLKELESYLQTHYILENCSFKVTYKHSDANYEIQLADLIVNTAYMRKKDRSIVEDVLKTWKKENFSLTLFPGKKHVGRIEKII